MTYEFNLAGRDPLGLYSLSFFTSVEIIGPIQPGDQEKAAAIANERLARSIRQPIQLVNTAVNIRMRSKKGEAFPLIAPLDENGGSISS